jgi:hypothetical protein
MRARIVVVLAGLVLSIAALPFGGCGDNDNSAPCCPVCGDGVCTGDEQGCNCPQDCAPTVCTALLTVCGDGDCQRTGSPAESHERCPADCGLSCQCASRVFVNGIVSDGSSCPAGTTEAYRDHGVIVCDACATSRDCDGGLGCHTQCGPGCENDTGGCCPVRVCSAG